MAEENLKKVLSSVDGLEITFFVEEGVARVDFRSDGTLYHLDNVDDVIVFIDGRSIPVVSVDEKTATAPIGDWSGFANRSVSLMIRVEEYFEGWEID